MPEREIHIATRLLRRQFEKAVGRSLPKIVTELITNSDDSYKRLESEAGSDASGRPRSGSITVVLDRPHRKFSVVDQAEGMTDVEMDQKFWSYGGDSGDRAAGVRTRSLFGKGLRDVLFTQKMGNVKSIKDGRLYTCKFRWKSRGGEERPFIDPTRGERASKAIRDGLGIQGDGTRVEFHLRHGVPLPQHERLVEKLSNFYMLRLINSAPNRSVRLLSIYSARRTEEAEIRYAFPEGEPIAEIDLEYPFEGYAPIRARGKILRSAQPLSQAEAGYEDREGGLLVVDEDDAVLDLTLFGYDESPHARHLFGRVTLVGAGHVIRHKLNQERPEEILTETRDGFDRRHDFYKGLRALIDRELKPIVEAEARVHQEHHDALSEETRKRHRKAFEKLNELYKAMVGHGGEGPGVPPGKLKKPDDVIAFLTATVTLVAGKATPVAVVVDAEAVGDGAEVTLASTHSQIEIEPSGFSVRASSSRDGVVMKLVRLTGVRAGIRGTVSAEVMERRASLDVTVIERPVYLPPAGIGFYPDRVRVHQGGRRTLDLYIDRGKVRLGSRINVESSDALVAKADADVLHYTAGMNLNEAVALAQFGVIGHGIGRQAVLKAAVESFSDEAVVDVVPRLPGPPAGIEGRFSDYDFASLDRKVQTWFDDERGVILVNLNDPTNRRYFGEGPQQAYESVERYAHCQIRLADLVLEECLQMMVSEAWHCDPPKIDRRLPDDPATDIRNYVCEKRFDVGQDIHQYFVKTEQLRRAVEGALRE